MKKVFTMKELESLYSGEWVLLVNPKHIERLEGFVESWCFTAKTEMKCIRKHASGRTLTPPSSM
jgi:hypothetical protein